MKYRFRRFILSLLALAFFSLIALFASIAWPVRASIYGPDVTTTGAAIDCGHNTTYVAANAFDNNPGTNWISLQSGTGIDGQACIGQAFAGSYDIRYITITQGSSGHRLASVYVQWSDDGTTYHTAANLTLVDDGSLHSFELGVIGSHPYWRLLASSNLAGSNSWSVPEIEMMEEIGNPPATATATATLLTSTPTLTLTPSITPSPTSDFYVVVTSAQTAPMRLERSGTFGDLSVIVVLLALVGMTFIKFAYDYWHEKRNVRSNH